MRASRILTVLCLAVACLAATACTPAGKATTPTAENGHGGAYPYQKFPPLKDRAIVDAAAEAFAGVRSARVLMHTTAKRDSTLTVAEDSEIVIDEAASSWSIQESMTGRRRYLTRVGDQAYHSVDGTKWSKDVTATGAYDFEPKVVAGMLREAKEIRLVAGGRPQEWSESATVVQFDRPKPSDATRTEQVVVFIDEKTKLVVRVEVLDDRDKPDTFTETFYRYSDYDSREISVEPPKT